MEGNKVLMKKKALDMIEIYKDEIKADELSSATISKYVADIKQWLSAMNDRISKSDISVYKEMMCEKYKVTSVNSKIISVNRYLRWLGYKELVVKTKRIQRINGLEKMITKEYYIQMLHYAKSMRKDKMYYIMKTIAQTGIRVSELKFVTVEAVLAGATIVQNKGKFRTVYFTNSLCRELLLYCEMTGCIKGIIFCGRESGKTITPGAVWKGLKYIAKQAGVPETIVYPHSFRHLFAKEYMRKVGDISELADLLGHSRLETTWIYTKTTSDEKKQRLERLGL